MLRSVHDQDRLYTHVQSSREDGQIGMDKIAKIGSGRWNSGLWSLGLD
jgi:hypothetical protein